MQKFITVLITCVIITSCTSSQKNSASVYQGYVKYQATETTGTVTVTSTGFGNKKPESIKDAMKEAFFTLLFRGIPGSQYELPMVPNEQEMKNKPAVTSLLEQGYSSFVTGNVVESEDKKVKGRDGAKGIMTVNRITINCDALRRYLEQNNITRKFGI